MPQRPPIDTDDLEPRSFSFNSPFGACPVCHGLGTRMEVDPELVVPDPRPRSARARSRRGAARTSPTTSCGWSTRSARSSASTSTRRGTSLAADARTSLLDGHTTKVHVVTKNRYGRQRAYYAAFEGVRPYVERRHREAESDTSRERFEGYMREVPCPACQRHPPQAGVAGGHARSETGRQEHRRGLRAADQRGRRLPAQTSSCRARERQIAERVLKEIHERLRFLLDVGLDYLSLDRPRGTLSGGEAQRIRLATQIGSGLVGVLYVLDEPSIGLHQRDNQRLIETLVRLRDLGNTLIVVEHDEDTIRAADWVVDIGPGAGEHGGQVVALRHRSRTCSTTPTR